MISDLLIIADNTVPSKHKKIKKYKVTVYIEGRARNIWPIEQIVVKYAPNKAIMVIPHFM